MDHVYDKKWQYNSINVIDCKTCGYMHIYPLLSAEEIEELEKTYVDDYWRSTMQFDYENITADAINKRKEEALSSRLYKNQYDIVNRYIKCDVKRLLDIGCGNELTQVYFKEKGWETFFVEPSRDAANYLKRFGLDGINGFFDTSLNLEPFSFINLSQVLELIPDPITFVKNVSNLLLPGGIIYISSGNNFSCGQMAYVEHYNVPPKWIAPSTVNYFTRSSLVTLLKKQNLNEVHLTTNFPLEFLLMSGLDYYSDDSLRSEVGPIVRNIENSFISTGREADLLSLYENLACLGFGRTVDIYCIKV